MSRWQSKIKPKDAFHFVSQGISLFLLPTVSQSIDTFKAAALPDEIQEGVDGLNRLDVAVVGQRTVPAALAWLDYDHNDDADEHGNQGGHHVVDHGAYAHLP